MSITDTIKTKFAAKLAAKLDALKHDPRYGSFVTDAERTVTRAVSKAGALAHDKRTEIDGYADKAVAAFNSRTESKYADKVAKVRTSFAAGVDKLAERRPVPPAQPTHVVVQVEDPAAH